MLFVFISLLLIGVVFSLCLLVGGAAVPPLPQNNRQQSNRQQTRNNTQHKQHQQQTTNNHTEAHHSNIYRSKKHWFNNYEFFISVKWSFSYWDCFMANFATDVSELIKTFSLSKITFQNFRPLYKKKLCCPEINVCKYVSIVKLATNLSCDQTISMNKKIWSQKNEKQYQNSTRKKPTRLTKHQTTKQQTSKEQNNEQRTKRNKQQTTWDNEQTTNKHQTTTHEHEHTHSKPQTTNKTHPYTHLNCNYIRKTHFPKPIRTFFLWRDKMLHFSNSWCSS